MHVTRIPHLVRSVGFENTGFILMVIIGIAFIGVTIYLTYHNLNSWTDYQFKTKMAVTILIATLMTCIALLIGHINRYHTYEEEIRYQSEVTAIDKGYIKLYDSTAEGKERTFIDVSDKGVIRKAMKEGVGVGDTVTLKRYYRYEDPKAFGQQPYFATDDKYQDILEIKAHTRR